MNSREDLGEKNMVIDEVVVLPRERDIAFVRFDLGRFEFNTLKI
jgi:hypothetical protein